MFIKLNMQKITIIQVGKTKNEYIQLENEFLKRLQIFADIEIKIIPEAKTDNAFRNKELEGIEIFKKIPQNNKIISLDENGQNLNSIEFSGFLNIEKQKGNKLTFIIGGAFGLSDQIKKIVNYSISLSKMTFTHQMVRIIFLEQLYRGYTIISGKKYHY